MLKNYFSIVMMCILDSLISQVLSFNIRLFTGAAFHILLQSCWCVC